MTARRTNVLRFPSFSDIPVTNISVIQNNPDILNAFITTLKARGVAGEERVATLLYLVLTSRLSVDEALPEEVDVLPKVETVRKVLRVAGLQRKAQTRTVSSVRTATTERSMAPRSKKGISPPVFDCNRATTYFQGEW